MTQAAFHIDPEPGDNSVVQRFGTVREATPRALVVETSLEAFDAQRAHSCLTSPREGDRVLVAIAPTGENWVLAVLDRAHDETVIEVDGDLAIRCRTGRLDLGAADGMSLMSGGEVSTTARSVHVRAVDADVAVTRLGVVSRYVMAELERVKCVGQTVHSVFDRLTQRVKHSLRTVEEIDQLKAKQIDYRSEETTSLRSSNTVVTAEQLVKLDGGQIHLG